MNFERDELLERYREKLSSYKEQWKLVKQLREHYGVQEARVLAAERVRTRIHDELRGLAGELGKRPFEVNIDILIAEENLREYLMPEFYIMKPWEVLDKPMIGYVVGGDEVRPIFEPIYRNKRPEIISQTEVFIPFGEETALHLFTESRFLFRESDDLERRRRTAKAVSHLGGKGRYVQFESHETFHRGVAYFGIACAKEDVDFVLDRLSQYRDEITVDHAQFLPEQIKRDAECILEDDVRVIMEHQLGPDEDRENLVKTYFEDRMAMLDRKDPLFEVLEREFPRAMERAKADDIRIEADQEERRDMAREEQIPGRYSRLLK